MTSLEEINDYYCPECGAPVEDPGDLCNNCKEYDYDIRDCYRRDVADWDWIADRMRDDELEGI